MINRTRGAIVAALLSSTIATTGCGDATTLLCAPELVVRVDALEDAAQALASAGAQLRTDVFAACTAIATDLDATVPAKGTMTDDEHLTAVCAAAKAAIDAQIAGGVTITIAAAPPRCTVDASAQLTCEAKCDVSGGCNPGEVEVRCMPGELSVVCDGMCDVNAYCEAEGSVAVNCEGMCAGKCEGTCSGNTNAAGECDGTCTGMCNGTCQVTKTGGIDCGANARCRGGCTGTATLPKCRGKLIPPSCNIDADCKAGCKSQAEFKADCEPGQLAFDISGPGHANLLSTLQTNLPLLLAVGDGLAEFFASAGDLATAGANVVSALSNVPACGVAAVAQLSGALEAAATASVTVTVSVSASVSIGGSVTN